MLNNQQKALNIQTELDSIYGEIYYVNSDLMKIGRAIATKARPGSIVPVGATGEDLWRIMSGDSAQHSTADRLTRGYKYWYDGDVIGPTDIPGDLSVFVEEIKFVHNNVHPEVLRRTKLLYANIDATPGGSGANAVFRVQNKEVILSTSRYASEINQLKHGELSLENEKKLKEHIVSSLAHEYYHGYQVWRAATFTEGGGVAGTLEIFSPKYSITLTEPEARDFSKFIVEKYRAWKAMGLASGGANGVQSGQQGFRGVDIDSEQLDALLASAKNKYGLFKMGWSKVKGNFSKGKRPADYALIKPDIDGARKNIDGAQQDIIDGLELLIANMILFRSALIPEGKDYKIKVGKINTMIKRNKKVIEKLRGGK